MAERLPVAVLGGSGYTGAELLRLLSAHPQVEIVAACADRSAGARVDQVFGHLSGAVDLTFEKFDADAIAARAQVVFCALPHGHSAAAVAALCDRVRTVIDLSADFRLQDAEAYLTWYGAPHPRPDLVVRAVYGLPELHRAELTGAALIANPGCYPTAALLASAPLFVRGLLRPGALVVDAKSGVSGAGRGPTQATQFAEVSEGIRAYKVAGAHRHTPEIEQEMSRVAGCQTRVLFTPHLVPMARGILSCVYGEPAEWATVDELRAAVVDFYRGEPFVTVVDNALPDTAHVRGTNRAHVAVHLDERAGRVLAMAAIDNLGKGAAGQAVQCMNLACGFRETEGLTQLAAFP